MFKKSFKGRIIFSVVMLMFALVVALCYYMSLEFRSFSDHLIVEKTRTSAHTLNEFLELSRNRTRVAAVSMAKDHEAIRALRKRDTKELLRVFKPSHDLFMVNYFTLTDNKGIVLARTHEDRIGDSIINQQNIKDALNGKVSSYYEEGTAVKVSVRTGAPVYDTDGKLLGVISAGVRFDTEETVDILKKIFNSEIAVFFGDTRIATTILKDGSRITGTKINPEIAKHIFEDKQAYHDDVQIFGANYRAYYKPLLNANNVVFAAFSIAIPMDEIITESDDLIFKSILIGLTALAISFITLYILISSISHPVVVLSKHMNTLANGSLDIKINIKRDDEVGNLSKSMSKVIKILRKLITDMNLMIAEQKKGNTDYTINTEEFHGDYKLLANNILELADLGMRDQLTGIPNRRAFDNRLELEWNRAVREKTSLAVLILDVDKFKNYNDAFGHPQGDLALKSVADTLRRLIKRSVDLAARWGGEEFIVLMPYTDINGAMAVAEQIRAGVENALVPCINPRAVQITVSIGVNAQLPEAGRHIGALISGADKALYQAKETGRNKVALNTDTASQSG